jgi:phage gp36-like protein
MSGTLTPTSIAFTLSGSAGGSGTLYRQTSGVDGSYGSIEELFELSLAETVQHDFSQRMLERNLRRASRQVDTLICHRFKTPLNAYSEAWVGWVCDMAAFYVMEVRGYQPGEEGRIEEARFVRKYKTAMELVKAAQDYMLTPDKRLLGTENPQPATPVSQGPNRNWLGTFNRSVLR